MKRLASSSHHRRILQEFTRQAEAFATAPAITNSAALDLLVQMSRAGPRDTVLDVACGAGLVVCAFAPIVRRATGIDITPAMIERARSLQQEKGAANVSWQVGSVLLLPYADKSFSIVTCRYALHHMENPAAVVSEATRVLKPDGKLVLVDMYASPDRVKAVAFNRMERLRDPSHVRAMALEELEKLPQQTGLQFLVRAFYSLDFELEALLQSSSAAPCALGQIRRMFDQDWEGERMAVQVRRQGSTIWLTYPIVVIVAQKPSAPSRSRPPRSACGDLV